MFKLLPTLVISLAALFSSESFAKQNTQEGVHNTCDVSGGRWVGSETGRWACCWADWGCYGCLNGICKMKCETQRCKDDNAQKRPGQDERAIEGLAPIGEMAPIIPEKNAPLKNPAHDMIHP